MQQQWRWRQWQRQQCAPILLLVRSFHDKNTHLIMHMIWYFVCMLAIESTYPLIWLSLLFLLLIKWFVLVQYFTQKKAVMTHLWVLILLLLLQFYFAITKSNQNENFQRTQEKTSNWRFYNFCLGLSCAQTGKMNLIFIHDSLKCWFSIKHCLRISFFRI